MPRIDQVQTYALAVPLARKIGDSQVSLTHWTVPVVELRDSEGRIGTGIGGVHTAADVLCDLVDAHYAPLLHGQPAPMIRDLWHRLYHCDTQWIGRSGATHMALSLVDIALWDLHAQAAGMPLWRLLGAHHTRLTTYNTDVGWLTLPLEDLVAGCAAAVEAGWSAVKIKVGLRDRAEDVRRVMAVREAIGPDIDLYVDANKVWTLGEALRTVRALEDAGVGWLEEPLHPDDVRGHAQLARATSIPIALGESLYSRHSFRDFLLADAVSIAQVDVTRVGGITEYLEIQAIAHSFGVDVIPHAGDMMVVHQHLAASAFAKTARIEYIPWTRAAFQYPVIMDGTDVVMPTAPGASTAIRRDAVENWRIPGVGSYDRL